jgi:prepilin-type N-terminal cleavage/methylation domain-containing protein/prepilin-type processing-associated H-X9-DG protein
MRRAGFTLIELLVVIAVIAILMAILIPALRAVRQRGQAVVCASNLKQLSLALATYDQENATFPPGFDDFNYIPPSPPGGCVGNWLYDKMGAWWFHFLAPSLGTNFSRKSVFWCPSRTVQDPTPRANVLCGNYGVNRAICKDAPGVMTGEFVGKPLSAYRIRPPEATLLIADSGYALISWRAATSISTAPLGHPNRQPSFYVPGLRTNKGRTLFPGSDEDAMDGRHPAKSVNAGFADGHVNTLKADDLLVEENGGSYINRSPLWLPRLSKAN